MPAVVKVTSLFFDRAVVTNAMDKANVRALSKAGAFIRRAAQTSMGYRKLGRASGAGNPPFAHREKGAKLRKLLFFSYDPQSKSVVVGPVAFGPKAEAPNLNEFGGTVTRRRTVRVAPARVRPKATKAQKAAFARKLKTGEVITAKPPTKVTTATAKYPPRPYMNPALQKELPNLPKRWANSLKGG